MIHSPWEVSEPLTAVAHPSSPLLLADASAAEVRHFTTLTGFSESPLDIPQRGGRQAGEKLGKVRNKQKDWKLPRFQTFLPNFGDHLVQRQ